MSLDPIRTRAELDHRIHQAIGPEPASTPSTNRHTWYTFTSQDLRGIPAIGRGVTGAIPDTEPGWNLDHWPTADEAA